MRKKKIQRVEPSPIRKQEGQLSVRQLSERKQREQNWADGIYAFGFLCLIVLPIGSLINIAMHFELAVWHAASLLLPAILVMVGHRWQKRFQEPICLRYGSKGVCLNDGEIWGWERVKIVCSMRGENLLGGHTLDVRNADKAILWLQIDGLAPVRLVAAPDKVVRSSRSRLAHPIVRFRHELGSLLGWLPVDAIQLTVSRDEWEEGRVFRPVSVDPDWLMYLLLTSVICAILWYVGGPHEQSTAVCGAISWLCFAAALLTWHNSLDRIVISRQGIQSRRHGLIRWEEIRQLSVPERWIRGYGPISDLETPPPGCHRGYRTSFPIVILESSRPNSLPIVWRWMDWPSGWRGFSDFRALCEEGQMRFAPKHEVGTN
ncbi:hypothetical protein [Chromobacterium sp. IIBBL 290-4]|uniref:hypothetical protein n=1 Tax=Chromobacterium sp. IIBBL 290-4 TaxID=2953890 RepID=UPI0020B8D232|nr:hypothetical protein [Chromobacterium sp. IIBBL 290-4]UTH74908.1 hypothetical protein NKT35_02035 [Chromobacterium sp. IIBBL 290-4]